MATRATGYCAFCKKQLAPSSATCPGCGNSEFIFATGKRREGPHFLCSLCTGSGKRQLEDWRECSQCGGRRHFINGVLHVSANGSRTSG
jgi:hypothetical protein